MTGRVVPGRRSFPASRQSEPSHRPASLGDCSEALRLRGPHEPVPLRGEQPLVSNADYPMVPGVGASLTAQQSHALLRSAYEELEGLLALLAGHERSRALAPREADPEDQAAVGSLTRRASSRAESLWELCGEVLTDAGQAEVWTTLQDICDSVLERPEDRFELVRAISAALASRPDAAEFLAGFYRGAHHRADPVAYCRDVASLARVEELSGEALRALAGYAAALAPDGKPQLEPGALLALPAPWGALEHLARATNLPWSEALELRGQRAFDQRLTPSSSLQRKLRGCAGEAAAFVLLNQNPLTERTLGSQARAGSSVADFLLGDSVGRHPGDRVEVKNLHPKRWDRMVELFARAPETEAAGAFVARLREGDADVLRLVQVLVDQLSRELESSSPSRRVVVLFAIGAAHREWMGPEGDFEAVWQRREELARMLRESVKARFQERGVDLGDTWHIDVRPVSDELAERCHTVLLALLGLEPEAPAAFQAPPTR